MVPRIRVRFRFEVEWIMLAFFSVMYVLELHSSRKKIEIFREFTPDVILFSYGRWDKFIPQFDHWTLYVFDTETPNILMIYSKKNDTFAILFY